MRGQRAVLVLLICLGALPLQLSAYEYQGDSFMLSLSGYLQSGAMYAFDKDTPKEDPSSELALDFKADVESWSSFKLFLQAGDDGKVIDPGRGLLFNEFDKIYQDKNPYVDIDEAYVDLFSSYVDFRIGIQKFAWGRLDEINPTISIRKISPREEQTTRTRERSGSLPSSQIFILT